MAEEKKNTCGSCAYKTNIPGDSHIGCSFAWEKVDVKPPKADPHGIKSGWYTFPLNFDPNWQQEECKSHSEVKEPEMVTQVNPLQSILSMIR